MDAAQRGAIEETLFNKKRDLETQKTLIQERIKTLQEQRMIELWNDINDAVKTVARQHEIKLVLSYGDPADKKEVNQFENVSRKLGAMDQGALIPLFVEPEVDLSDEVTRYLNTRDPAEEKAEPGKK